MLSEQSIKSIYPLARNLDQRSLMLSPLKGSVIDTLCKNSYTDDEIVKAHGGSFLMDIKDLEVRTNAVNVATGVCDQNDYMCYAVDKVSEAVTAHLNFARTVVSPAVQELADRIQPLLDQVNRSSFSNLDIIMFAVPGPLQEPSFLESALRAKDSNQITDFNAGAKLDTATYEQILEMAKTGSASVDESLSKYFAQIGEPTVVKIYEDLFTESGSGGSITSFLNSGKGVEYMIVGFALARRLWNNPPDNTNMSGAQYESYMVDVRDICAQRISALMAKLDRDDRNDLLIRNYTSATVEVNEAVYRRWLANGGSNEILFGCVLSTDPEFIASKISEKSTQYAQSWEHFKLLNRTTEANRRFAESKKIARLEFVEVMQKLTHDECPEQNRAVIFQKFEEALNCTREDEIDDIYNWVLRLLCSSRFDHTSAYQILNGIALVKKHSPGVETREAAAVSAIEYLAYWVFKQFNLTSASY
jgi:hypothetical protein